MHRMIGSTKGHKMAQQSDHVPYNIKKLHKYLKTCDCDLETAMRKFKGFSNVKNNSSKKWSTLRSLFQCSQLGEVETLEFLKDGLEVMRIVYKLKAEEEYRKRWTT